LVSNPATSVPWIRREYGNHGSIELSLYQGVVVIHSMADDDKFTFNMLKDIMLLNKQYTICLIIDTKSKQESLARVLSKRYEVTYVELDGMLFAFI